MATIAADLPIYRELTPGQRVLRRFMRRRGALVGLAVVVFFILLAPSSLMPGTVQTIVEHRMYLPLAAVLALVIAGVFRLAGARGLVVLAVAVPVLGAVTFQRNADYHSALW